MQDIPAHVLVLRGGACGTYTKNPSEVTVGTVYRILN